MMFVTRILMSSLLVASVGCGGTTPAPVAPHGNDAPTTAPVAEAPTQIVFQFHDSSVPPQYHRSWTVTITPTSARKVVDSYGDVLSDATADLTAAQYAEIVAALDKSGLAVVVEDAATVTAHGGCTGGTGHSLALTAADGTVTTGHVDHCGGSDSGTLTGDTAAFATALAPYLPADQDGPQPAP